MRRWSVPVLMVAAIPIGGLREAGIQPAKDDSLRLLPAECRAAETRSPAEPAASPINFDVHQLSWARLGSRSALHMTREEPAATTQGAEETPAREPRTAVLTQQRPLYHGSEDGAQAAFDGDFSRTPSVIRTIVTGATTLGTPKSGYLYTPGATGTPYSYFYNESGWNERADGNAGRTGATACRTRLHQHGRGDLAGHTGSVLIWSAAHSRLATSRPVRRSP